MMWAMAEAEDRPGTEGIAGLDTSVAHPARVYDYWLGGKDNFAADREAAERVLAAAPGLRYRVRANRAFLGRATRYLAAEAGIRSGSTTSASPRRRPCAPGSRWPGSSPALSWLTRDWCRYTSGGPTPATSPRRGPCPRTARSRASRAPSRSPGRSLAVTWSARARSAR